MQLNELHAFCVYGVLGFYAFFTPLFYLLFATYLRQDKKVDNVGQNPTNLNIIRKTKCSGISEQNVPFLKTKRTSVNLFPSPSTK